MKHHNSNPRPTAEARRVVTEAIARAASEGRNPSVLFVCLGNICRSPAAEGITARLARDAKVNLDLDSAGFYGGHAGELPDSRMRQAAWQRGYRLDHHARKIRSYDLDRFDVVIGMDDYNIRDLHKLADTDERDSRIVRMTDFATAHPGYDSVPDPYYEGAAGFQLVLDLLEDACGNLVDMFKPSENKESN